MLMILSLVNIVPCFRRIRCSCIQAGHLHIKQYFQVEFYNTIRCHQLHRLVDDSCDFQVESVSFLRCYCDCSNGSWSSHVCLPTRTSNWFSVAGAHIRATSEAAATMKLMPASGVFCDSNENGLRIHGTIFSNCSNMPCILSSITLVPKRMLTSSVPGI